MDVGIPTFPDWEVPQLVQLIVPVSGEVRKFAQFFKVGIPTLIVPVSQTGRMPQFDAC
jgi:hypothetical protein